MPRWEPDASGRMQAAALDLFAERGYAATTVEDVAARAGVTTRTFFRHFADKREVLFGGGEAFQQRFVDALAAVPPGVPPLTALATAVRRVCEGFDGQQEHARRRSRVIAAHPELRERELAKLAEVAAALAAALRDAGVLDLLAAVSAETAVGVFRTAFDAWVDEDEQRELTAVLDEALAALRALTG